MEINVYDMLVFEDEAGSIYQDCVCSISKEISNEDKKCIFVSCSLFGIDQYKIGDIVCRRNGLDNPWYYDTKIKLKEVWSRTQSHTYRKVYELIDGEMIHIEYYNGRPAYHRRQAVTYDQIKNFVVEE